MNESAAKRIDCTYLPKHSRVHVSGRCLIVRPVPVTMNAAEIIAITGSMYGWTEA